MVPEDSNKANGTPNFQNWEVGPTELLSRQPHLIPRKTKEWLILEIISEHEDKKVAWSSQHGFIKRKSCLTNLIAFYDEATT